MKKKISIVGYARISFVEDKANYESIRNQKNIIKEYAERNFGINDIEFYEDENYSGYSFNRPAFLRLKEEALKGNIDTIIVKDLSRLGRHNAKTLLFIEEMQDLGVRVIAIGDSIDTSESNNDVTMGVKTWYNELYVKDISKKIRATITSKQKNADWICAVPYGYKMIDTKNHLFEVDEVAAEVVNRIFELYTVDGWGYKKIANYLTDNNVPTPRMREKELKEEEGKIYNRKIKKEWSLVTISGILSNDFYIGTLRTGKYARKKINGTDMKINETEHYIFEDNHEPIVTKKVFNIAQEMLKRRSTNHYRGVKKYKNVYSGLLTCGDCGAPMFSISSSKRPNAYICGSYHRRGLKGCTSHHTLEGTLNLLLRNYLISLRKSSTDMIMQITKELNLEKKKGKKESNSLDKLKLQIDKAKNELKALKMQRMREIMKKPDQTESLELLYDEIEREVIDRIINFENQVKYYEKLANDSLKIKKVAKSALSIFDDIINKNEFNKLELELIIDKIVVYENKIEVNLKPDVSSIFECGMHVNFNQGNKNILTPRTVVQSIKNHQDKVFVSNVICSGSPSLILKVLLISFGITTLPKSSILLTMPVAFIYIYLLKDFCLLIHNYYLHMCN